MRATRKDGTISDCDKLAVDTNGLQNLLDCGRATAVEIGGQAGARIEVGKRLLWNVSKVQSYIDSLAEEQNKDE